MELLKKQGRPRIGTWRCYATMPDEITERIDAHRKLTGDTRNAAARGIPLWNEEEFVGGGK